MSFNPATLAAKAADLHAQGVVVNRPKTNFKVTTKHIGKRSTVDLDGEHDRAWWIEYEAQNR